MVRANANRHYEMIDYSRGTQHERTALSQNRTGLATLVLSIAFIRFASVGEAWAGATLASLALLVSLVELWVSRTSYRSRVTDHTGRPRRLGAALVSATAVALVALAGFFVAL